MKEIPLGGRKAAGRVALIDDEDYELISAYQWYVKEVRRADGGIDGPYARTTLPRNGRAHAPKISMHTLITGFSLTDHRNGNGLDNRRSNLRDATKAQNNHNQRPVRGHSSRFKGVTWRKDVRKWQASIKINGTNHYLGCYSSEEEAAQAYEAAALAAYGEYAYAARALNGLEESACA